VAPSQAQRAYPSQPSFPGQPGAANAGPMLPDGIDQLVALQSVNQILVFGTKEGYETALEVARNIDGDLDIIRTQFTLARTTRAGLTGLGVTLTADPLTTSDIARLVAARQAGKLQTLDTVRITTREDTVVDALLGEHQRRALPLTMIPRVAKDGTVEVQLTQPLDTTIAAPSGQTTVAVVPGGASSADAPVSLLFVTPAILPSDYRPGR
jgi:hypothetical protein